MSPPTSGVIEITAWSIGVTGGVLTPATLGATSDIHQLVVIRGRRFVVQRITVVRHVIITMYWAL